jgi:putative ABC transport system permease protein
MIEALPATYLGAVRVPDSLRGGGWLSALVQQYPNVLAIDVGELIRQVQSIIDQVAKAVEFVFLFTLLGGLLVLQSAIAATQDERKFDAAIMRTLGASRAQLAAAQVAEFLVLGALSGLLAAAGATAVAAMGWATVGAALGADGASWGAATDGAPAWGSTAGAAWTSGAASTWASASASAKTGASSTGGSTTTGAGGGGGGGGATGRVAFLRTTKPGPAGRGVTALGFFSPTMRSKAAWA